MIHITEPILRAKMLKYVHRAVAYRQIVKFKVGSIGVDIKRVEVVAGGKVVGVSWAFAGPCPALPDRGQPAIDLLPSNFHSHRAPLPFTLALYIFHGKVCRFYWEFFLSSAVFVLNVGIISNTNWKSIFTALHFPLLYQIMSMIRSHTIRILKNHY